MTSSGKLGLEHQYKGDAIHGMAGRAEKRSDCGGHVCLAGGDRLGQCRTRGLSARRERAGLWRAARGAYGGRGARGDRVDPDTHRCPPDAIAVAIETPRGVLVDTLIDQGFPVFAINPKQLDRFRDRFTASGAKDDRRDGHALADGLRTDARAFRRVHPDDPAIIQLREICRMTEALQEQEQRLANRLRDQLFRLDAAWLALSPAADDPWLWTLLRETPDPAAWPRLARRRVAAALRAHRIRRLTVEDVMAVLRQPRLTGAPGVADAVALRIASLVPQLLLVHEQRTAAERGIEQALDALAAAPATEAESR